MEVRGTWQLLASMAATPAVSGQGGGVRRGERQTRAQLARHRRLHRQPASPCPLCSSRQCSPSRCRREHSTRSRAPTNERVGLGGGEGEAHGVPHRMHHQAKCRAQGCSNEDGGRIQASLQASRIRAGEHSGVSCRRRRSGQATQLPRAAHTAHTSAKRNSAHAQQGAAAHQVPRRSAHRQQHGRGCTSAAPRTGSSTGSSTAGAAHQRASAPEGPSLGRSRSQ